MRVLYVCNFESPYRIDFWNELTKYCDVTVLFSESKEQQVERNSKWFSNEEYKFAAKMLKQTKLTKKLHICFGVKEYLKRDYDLIIFHPYSPITCMYGISYCIRNKISYVINSDGGFAKDGKGFQERLKRYLISHADAFTSTATATDEYLSFYGGNSNRMYRYTLTTVREKDILRNIITDTVRQQLRKKIGLLEDKIVVSVGNMIPRKGFDLLLKADRKVDKSIGIYIVGGKPTEEYLQYVDKYKLNNIHFVDFMSKNDLREFYLASDVFVLPTREDIWGLVVVEAMTCGLPVITTNRCIAGLELITNGENGFVYDVNDTDSLASLINSYFESPDTMQKMKECVLKGASGYSIEEMAIRHAHIFEEMVSTRINGRR